MPPKKREKDVDPAKSNPRIDHIQADHELFLQAYEKPTQIYRYLRTRNMLSPIFLNRTLMYMRHRMSRSHKLRANFSMDGFVTQLRQKEAAGCSIPAFINLTFFGFFDQRESTVMAYRQHSLETVRVEALLVKICHKKRKDSSTQSLQASMGFADVSVNPVQGRENELAPTISIPTESLGVRNGNNSNKSFVLLLHVTLNYSSISDASVQIKSEVDMETGIEPAQKRRKSETNSNGASYTSNGMCTDSAQLYYSELTVYDKYNRCPLTEADYETILQEVVTLPTSNKNNASMKYSQWENTSELGECPAETFTKLPTLKFKLNWSDKPLENMVKRPEVYSSKGGLVDCSTANVLEKTTAENGATATTGEQKMQIVYQFMYNNNSRQQTEPCEDLHCPWCSIDCHELYTLLKHLKLCHSRFTFKYEPISVGARIDVNINELYDGSYVGSPQDLVTQPSVCAFSRNGPVRRATVSHILVCHPRRPKPSLSEFLELDDCEYDGQRPFITGHNRLYHHTTTCLPIYPKEMDVDSEGENDPEWLRSKTVQMIDEFTDVNDGEKELMKLWNLHVMQHGFVGDCQIPVACEMFVQRCGVELIARNLYRNFVLHLNNFVDFGLISALAMYTILRRLQDVAAGDAVMRTALQDSRVKHRENWARVASTENKTGSGAVASAAKTPIRKMTAGMQRRKGTPSSASAVIAAPTATTQAIATSGTTASTSTLTNGANASETPTRRKSATSAAAANGTEQRKRLSLSLKQTDSSKNTA